MRDKNRIKPLLKQIEKIWLTQPDLRLGQLLGNCEIDYWTEDGELEERLKGVYGNENS